MFAPHPNGLGWWEVVKARHQAVVTQTLGRFVVAERSTELTPKSCRSMNRPYSPYNQVLVSLFVLFLIGYRADGKSNPHKGSKIVLSLTEKQLLGKPSTEPPIQKKGSHYEVVFKGSLYKPPLNIPLKPKNLTDRSTPEEALSLDHYANVQNNPQLILNGWMPNEHKALRKMMEIPQIRERNHYAVSKVRSMQLYGKLYYKDTVLMLIGNNGHKKPVALVFVLKKAGKSWLLTNHLNKDPVIKMVWAAHNQPNAIRWADK